MGNLDGKDTGIIPNKFFVVRSDGTSAYRGKHYDCTYFVLDWEHDPFAIPAALAYAKACKDKFPKLAAELRAKAKELRSKRKKGG